MLENLRKTLTRLDGRSYRGLRGIRGCYHHDAFAMHIEYVQGDPFASPSRIRIVVTPEVAAIPSELRKSRTRRVAAADYLLRAFAEMAHEHSSKLGSGKSGLLYADRPGQEVLERSGCDISPEGEVTLRFYVGIPAKGRRIKGHAAAQVLTETVPEMVTESFARLALPEFPQHIRVVEDQEALRHQLDAAGLIAFVANGAILPRSAGDDPRPMKGGKVVPFSSPEAREVELTAPNAGPLRGLGITRGITLICGGGYHGKSTLLSAIASGIYNHIPGDGREQVVTVPDALKIRAEDGRRVCGVDISPFIDNLPAARSTHDFTSDDASGSTSQAAAVVEALELGAEALLLDEDTCATNFMIRDRRMQQLVAKEREPITPFLDRIRSIYEDLETSVVLVMGGSGDYFDVADTVLVMDAYQPRDATAEAQQIATDFPTGREREEAAPLSWPTPRIPLRAGFDPSRGRGDKVRARGMRSIEYGRYTIDISALEQLASASQTRTLADTLVYILRARLVDDARTLAELLDALEERFDEEGPLAVAPWGEGDRAEVRSLEIGAAINRLRTLLVRQHEL